jgi:competence protein ComFA
MFVPLIARVLPLVERLQSWLPDVRIDGTSAKDSLRAAKVDAFRKGAIRLLVTTTILERGVTVPFADVYIMDADSSLFDAAALVQMAGRAGRSAKDPHGNVYFCAHTWTNTQQDAANQIKSMNRIARQEGYLNV